MGKVMSEKVKLSLSLSKYYMDRVDECAKGLGISRSATIKILIDSRLSKLERGVN